MTQRGDRVVVTGADGFLGRNLVSLLERSGHEVWRLGRNVVGERAIAIDLRKSGRWQEHLRELCPDAVIHLAGLVRGDNLNSFNRVHLEGTRNLFEGIRGTDTWVALASSSAVYGSAEKSSLPLREDSPCCPMNAYAESKLAQEQMAMTEVMKNGPLKLCICRLSNLIGRGQSEAFFLARMVGKIARLARLEQAEERELETGSLSATRDFIDVRDACEALAALFSVRAEGVFNVASGREILLRDAVAVCLSEFDIEVKLQENPELYVSPIQRQALDISAIRAICGWRPAFTLKNTLKDTIACVEQGKPTAKSK